jgi:hypothetical protein
MKRSEAEQNEPVNAAVVKRLQREIADALGRFPSATILERLTAIYRIAQAATESAVEHSNPIEREQNKRVMREVLGSILLDTLGPKRETVH